MIREIKDILDANVVQVILIGIVIYALIGFHLFNIYYLTVLFLIIIG